MNPQKYKDSTMEDNLQTTNIYLPTHLIIHHILPFLTIKRQLNFVSKYK